MDVFVTSNYDSKSQAGCEILSLCNTRPLNESVNQHYVCKQVICASIIG